jgi:hypothetical protein
LYSAVISLPLNWMSVGSLKLVFVLVCHYTAEKNGRIIFKQKTLSALIIHHHWVRYSLR